jgi:hypothetical protein
MCGKFLDDPVRATCKRLGTSPFADLHDLCAASLPTELLHGA